MKLSAFLKMKYNVRGPPQGRLDSRIHGRFSSFSRIHECQRNGWFHERNSVTNHKCIGVHEFTNKCFNFHEFTNDIYCFHESRTTLFSRIHERFFSFSRIHERKKANSRLHERRWGGLFSYSNLVNIGKSEEWVLYWPKCPGDIRSFRTS